MWGAVHSQKLSGRYCKPELAKKRDGSFLLPHTYRWYSFRPFVVQRQRPRNGAVPPFFVGAVAPCIFVQFLFWQLDLRTLAVEIVAVVPRIVRAYENSAAVTAHVAPRVRVILPLFPFCVTSVFPCIPLSPVVKSESTIRIHHKSGLPRFGEGFFIRAREPCRCRSRPRWGRC